MDRDFKIEIRSQSLEAMGRDFIQAWHDTEEGKVAAPSERVYFEDLKTLVQILTAKRIEVLKVLHENGPLSIRALAKMLRRDYKNVHQDIQLLERIGLVEETENGLVAAPFERIVAEIKLAA